ncbi:bifunctional aspartokinase/homoserine dehydrogenase 1 [Dioscorea cayenensis subsp. rotundata]|uniref:Homoserine dehydrogenase n=1 Tax=Dioscorea cayennensis subsp. rotundata TaxID=55577 RepID=A0AB40D0H8_DIOCR|nr:bifunctional aspartokinase/homoserine dehydrogenase 1 [Dioscorea cayenensis subsp. rotundata]
MKSIRVLVMGCGGVGRQLLEHIISCRSLHAQQNLVLRVVGVCDSQSLLLVDDVSEMELNDEFLLELCRAKSAGSPLSSLRGSGKFHVFENFEVKEKVIDAAGLLGSSSGLAVVDCSASSETVEILMQAIDLGCCVVLANKKPLTCKIDEYEKLVSKFRHIRYESTVGAGLPVIASITRVLASGDPIFRIIGSLSGTLGYVMSELEDGKLFSQVVNAAKGLGYTEPDPRDDLGGMDVARKALILARLLGWRINLDELKVESLYPNELGPSSMSTEEFLNRGLQSLDSYMADKVRGASLKGNVLRYVCVIEGSRCHVGLQELPKDSPLGRLRGSDNVIEIYSRCYKKSPLVIQGAGAGNDTTAAGVLADIIDLQDLFL